MTITMRHRKYKVVLTGYTSIQYAFTERAATILAQAEAIKNANDYELISIEDITNLDNIYNYTHLRSDEIDELLKIT